MALNKYDETPSTKPSQGLYGELDMLNDKELLLLRGEIDVRLKLQDLGEIDVGLEIVLQLRTLKELQNDALGSTDTPVNQKAQATNTVSSLLKDLVKSRAKLWDAERSKAIEAMTIEAMRTAPQEAKEQFFENLERMLSTLPSLASLMDSE